MSGPLKITHPFRPQSGSVGSPYINTLSQAQAEIISLDKQSPLTRGACCCTEQGRWTYFQTSFQLQKKIFLRHSFVDFHGSKKKITQLFMSMIILIFITSYISVLLQRKSTRNPSGTVSFSLLSNPLLE